MNPRRSLRQIEGLASRGEKMGLSSLPLQHDDRLRPCLFFAPRGGAGADRLPLLLALHGGAGNPLAMARKTRFHEIAARESFIVAYPGGAGPSLRHSTWNAGGAHVDGWAEENRIDDVGYIRKLIDAVAGKLPVDRERIYAAGISKGAMMAYRLALEASDAIAAIAAVAGPMCGEPAARPRPVSVFHIHGGRDERVPFRGGRGRFTRKDAVWPSSEEGLDYWRRVNDAADKDAEKVFAPEVTRQRSAGTGGKDVEVVLLEKRGHEWPKPKPAFLQRILGAAPGDGLDASEEIWRFLRDKKLG